MRPSKMGMFDYLQVTSLQDVEDQSTEDEALEKHIFTTSCQKRAKGWLSYYASGTQMTRVLIGKTSFFVKGPQKIEMKDEPQNGSRI